MKLLNGVQQFVLLMSLLATSAMLRAQGISPRDDVAQIRYERPSELRFGPQLVGAEITLTHDKNIALNFDEKSSPHRARPSDRWITDKQGMLQTDSLFKRDPLYIKFKDAPEKTQILPNLKGAKLYIHGIKTSDDGRYHELSISEEPLNGEDIVHAGLSSEVEKMDREKNAKAYQEILNEEVPGGLLQTKSVIEKIYIPVGTPDITVSAIELERSLGLKFGFRSAKIMEGEIIQSRGLGLKNNKPDPATDAEPSLFVNEENLKSSTSSLGHSKSVGP